jgi:hypothetical protein
MNANGGSPNAASHTSTRITNPMQLYPLSTIVYPTARFRSRNNIDLSTPADADGKGIFAFTDIRDHPVHKGAVCQDLVIFRSSSFEMEVGRLTMRRATPSLQVASDSRAPRTSALTEMMRVKAGYGDKTDLHVEQSIGARWRIPLDDDDDIYTEVVKTRSAVEPIRSRWVALPPGCSMLTKLSLARAEIQTHTNNPRILPSSIYTSRQVDFYAARAIDEYSPLSILDVEARTRRLIFRPEVEVRSTSLESNSFDEPLLTALHSHLESPTHPLIPGLPNGSPDKSRWSSIPIRQVASGLGEGVGRVRMEYARAQHVRLRRRLSEAEANKLSFEEDTIFPSSMSVVEDEEEMTSNSSPSSGILPGSQGVDEEEWGEGWEEEYRKAVEDDGGPEELVLGLMDEEEERGKWEVKRRDARFGG